MRRSGTIAYLGLALGLFLTAARAKPLALDKLWVIDAPEDWWYAEVSKRGEMRVYTYGPATPDPAKGAQSLFAVIGPKKEGASPQIIRGISMAVALGPGALVVVQGAQKVRREGRLLREGYASTAETTDGSLILHTYSLSAAKLPGEPLPNAGQRIVLVNIAGTSAEEVERYEKVFETIQAAAKPE